MKPIQHAQKLHISCAGHLCMQIMFNNLVNCFLSMRPLDAPDNLRQMCTLQSHVETRVKGISGIRLDT